MRGAGGLKQALLLLFVWGASVFGVLPVQAQPQYDKVVVPWGNVPPLSMMGDDGEPTGFAIELARLLAEEVGFELEFQFYGPIPKIAAAQATGETDMLVGVGHGPAFRETNLASQTISEVQVRLAVPVENADDFDPNNLSGVRIAAVPPTIASNPDLFPDATVVEQPGLEAALVTLLSGEVDALSYPVNVLFALTRATRTDGRIAYVGDPLVRIDRVVIVHESRAELLEPINKALQKFEENGTLEELRIKYLISNPEPVPDVLTVGVHHVPPFVSIGDDGTPGGFGIEVLEDLVDLAGLQIRYQRITDEEFGQGPREGSVDLIPMMAINPTRAERMDFTFPVHRVPFNIFTLREVSLEPQVLDDLIGLRVGVESGKNAAQLAERHGGLDIVYAEGKDGIMNLLLEGQADAVLT
ncbi:MAG: transporter substrate-binding domain-containing protein, partial [Tritonibacter mobilis]|nr:transporter substrate-binding domain-containing protein [Tritonibacter mobilis]